MKTRQLSLFNDLAPLPSPTAAPSVPALLWPAWEIYEFPRGQWCAFHFPTAIETRPLSSAAAAVEEATRISVFFELLPARDLQLLASAHPEWITRLPSTHYYRYWHLVQRRTQP